MERKFYNENFEKFLKGHADQFKMTPSKKVWHGIYNDLHPGQRWPSIAMSMVFIFMLVIIGHLNTNNGHNTALPDVKTIAPDYVTKVVKNSTKTRRTFGRFIPAGNSNQISKQPETAPETSPATTDQATVIGNTRNDEILLINSSVPGGNKNDNNSEKTSNDPVNSSDIAVNLEPTQKESTEKGVDAMDTKSSPAAAENISTANETAEITAPANEAALKILKKKKDNISWTYQITPSLSYRSFSDKAMDNAVVHGSIMGYEAGVTMGISLIKKLQFTTGFQFNYAGYNIRANNSHPIVASLMLNSETPGQYNTYSAMSHYGNATGNDYTKLKNYSLQASIPIGLRYDFGENQNVAYGVSATVQPSLILSNRAFLLSTDKRNYLLNPALYRNWNMNGSFSVFTSITSNALKLQVGPQVRYQFLSSYTDRYTVKEHLINYGIRVGISKSSK